jgi:hypothetical protein
VSVVILQAGNTFTLTGHGYVTSADVMVIEGVFDFANQFAIRCQEKFEAWAAEREEQFEAELAQVKLSERAGAHALVDELGDAAKRLRSEIMQDDQQRIKSLLTSVLSEKASTLLLASGVAKAFETGNLDEHSTLTVALGESEQLLLALQDLLPDEHFSYVETIIHERHYVEQKTALIVSPSQAFKLDTSLMVEEILAKVV